MSFSLRQLRNATAVVATAATLSSCVAAVPMVMMAASAGAVALAGFAIYKTVQTASGGQVRIEFGSTDAKKATPPKPLPPGNVVYVYGGGAREKKFVETLQASGKFRSVTGGQDAHAPDLAAMNSGQVDDAMRDACRSRRPDLVFAAINVGVHVQSNLLSLKRGNATQQVTLQTYDCRAQRVGWTENMAVVNESHKDVPAAEIDGVAGQAWAERVLEAKKLG